MIWATLVTLAAALVEQESEAAKRSAISRAYYGAFNEARRRLAAHGIRVADHRAHSQVCRTFKDADAATPETHQKWQQVGDLMWELRSQRIEADYVDGIHRLDRKAADAVGVAHRILALLDELEFS